MYFNFSLYFKKKIETKRILISYNIFKKFSKMPRQNNSFGFILFILPFIIGMFIKRSNYHKNNNDDFIKKCRKEIQNLKKKVDEMKEEKLNDSLKMKEWKTIIPSENILLENILSENISSESIIEPHRLPVDIDPNWMAFVLLQ